MLLLYLHKDQLSTRSVSEKVTASLSMIKFAIHLHMYVWIINQLLTWPSLRGDGTAVCFPSSSLPVAGTGVLNLHFRL